MIRENKSRLAHSWKVLKNYIYSCSSNEDDSKINRKYCIDEDIEEQNNGNILHQNTNLNMQNIENDIAIMPANDTENNDISDHHFLENAVTESIEAAVNETNDDYISE